MSKYSILFNSQKLNEAAKTREGITMLRQHSKAMINELLDYYEVAISRYPRETAETMIDHIEEHHRQHNQGILPEPTAKMLAAMRARIR